MEEKAGFQPAGDRERMRNENMMDFQAFYDGKVFDAYRYLGAHPDRKGVTFRTYAPSAQQVAVIGEFNGWQEEPMTQPVRSGFWEMHAEGAKPGQMYKYVIYSRDGRVEHCDPYGFGMEKRPGFASIVRDLSEYTFHDGAWMKKRTRCFDRPLNIFEVHLGSFRTNPDDSDGWYRYDEIADDLIDYVKKYHFTHVEFMPLAEHPFDGSWGYQETGYFSPTSRYGTASQLMELVDRLHQAGIGAIVDFVPAHFALDWYALRRYDGTELYEYPPSDVSESEWGSCNFIFSRREVACFMQSAANYWLTEYHFDGLRMDAVSRMIYWQGNEARGVNTNSVDFLRSMNAGLHRLHPDAMLIAEDSTAYPGCTKAPEEGGLGFDYKWDLGWMNDTLDYFMKTTDERRSLSQKLTFSMYYFYRERHLLPFSHDEVVHGKRTIIGKIYGEYEEKFAQLRTLYLYMLAHPGKTLNFMGNEIAMFREWDETREPDYNLLDYPMHRAFSGFFAELMELGRTHPAFYEMDYEPGGFQWLSINESGNDVYVIRRNAREESLVIFFNFSNSMQNAPYQSDYDGHLELLLHSDWERFGGGTKESREGGRVAISKDRPIHLVLPAFSAAVWTLKP